jgi:anhydro-N-acetylmuramic acid kinase
MSGTSADAVDAALVSIDDNHHLDVVSVLQLPLPEPIREHVIGLFNPGTNEIDRVGELDVTLGTLFAEAALRLITQAGHSSSDIAAIGSHGQTIRHRPRNHSGVNFTLQIGDPNTIAQLTGITTVADFRRRDMAAGGQGAPLVPAFHHAVFADPQHYRVVLNIGGIANITVLHPDGAVRGYDTGPGNGLMDAWTTYCTGNKIDRNGEWAKRGTLSRELFNILYSHPYFTLSPPKSTGREEFSLDWLQKILQAFPALPHEDVQATLLELTARSIADQIDHWGSPGDVLVCGGGAHNGALMARLKTLLPAFTVRNTGVLGIPADYVEAVAFAWLAMRTLNRLSGNIPAVTGAHEEVVLGGIYPGAPPEGLNRK